MNEAKLAPLLLMIIFFAVYGCSEQPTQPVNQLPGLQSSVDKQKTTSVTSLTTVESGVEEMSSTYSYRPEGRRDPFRSLLLTIKEKRPASLTPLQQRSLGEIRVIGIIWGKDGHLAMVETPDGKGYLIKEGTLIGPEGGIVKKITDDSIIITETFTDYYGRRQSKRTVVRLHAKEEGGV